MKHNPQGITTAMQLYFSGESPRKVAHSLKLIGIDVSHRTIYNWIDKYTSLMNKYLDKITPKVSTAWRTDDLYLKVRVTPSIFAPSWMMKPDSGLLNR
jgi:putative transposase